MHSSSHVYIMSDTNYSPFEQYLSTLPEWRDNQRCLSLFSPFRGDRSDAPEAWDAKLAFWKRLILYSAPFGWLGEHYPRLDCDDILLFSPTILPQRFSRFGASPLGLSYVVNDMVTKKELVPIAEFWIKDTVLSTIKKGMRSSMNWIWNAMNQSIFNSTEDDSNIIYSHLVIIPIVQQLSAIVLSFIHSNYHNLVDNCFTWIEWKSLVQQISTKNNWSKPSDRDILILIQHLVTSNKAIVSQPFSNDSHPSFVYIIHDSKIHDRPMLESISQVKHVIHKLESQLSILDDQIHRLDTQTRNYLKVKNRQMALKSLSRKHDLISYQDKQSHYLNNLSNILLSIRSAKDQEQVLEAYNVGTSTLNKILSKKELSIETIDNITESFTNALEESRQLDIAMKTIIPSQEYELDELERELEELVSQENSVQELLKELEGLKIPEKEFVENERKLHHNVYLESDCLNKL